MAASEVFTLETSVAIRTFVCGHDGSSLMQPLLLTLTPGLTHVCVASILQTADHVGRATKPAQRASRKRSLRFQSVGWGRPSAVRGWQPSLSVRKHMTETHTVTAGGTIKPDRMKPYSTGGQASQVHDGSCILMHIFWVPRPALLAFLPSADTLGFGAALGRDCFGRSVKP